MNAFLRLLRHAAPYRGRLTVALLAMIVYAAGSVGIVTQVGPIFDGVLPAGASLPRVAALLLGAYLLKGAGAYVSGYSMTYVGQRVVMNLRTRLYGHILNQSAAFFARRTSGQLMSRITNDVAQVQQAVAETVADLVRESLAVVGYTGYLFFIDWRLALVCLCAAPLVIYPLARLGQRVRSTTRRSQEDLEQLTHVANEGLAGHRIVKAFRAEPREVTRFEQATERLFRTTMRVVGAVAVLPPLMEFVGGLAAVAALWYGSRQVALGELSTGEFAAFLTAAFMMYAPVKKLSRVNAGLQQAIAASERIFGMLDTHTEVQDRPGAPPLAPLRQAVIFDDVGFAYEDDPDRFILRHVSFRASAGQVVEMVVLMCVV